MVRYFWLLTVFLGSTGGLVVGQAQPDVIARLDNYDGNLTVVRAGLPVQASLVDTGFNFENNDQVKVSRDGAADISLDTKTGIRANLHLKASTVILLDLTSLANHGQPATIDLLAGAIALKVEKIVGPNSLSVSTETANMGVRGTEFAVDTEVDGSLLLTTTEGQVELTPASGPSHFSVPGVAVRGDGDESPQWTETKLTDLNGFADSWHRERLANFEAHRGIILGRLADRYQRLSTRFDRAFARLEETKDLWSRWASEEKAGTRSPGLADARARRLLQANLMVVRQVAWNLERLDRRLRLVEDRLGPEAFMALDVKVSSGTWAGFVAGWRTDREALESKLAQAHYRIKLFALRHGPLDRAPKPVLETD